MKKIFVIILLTFANQLFGQEYSLDSVKMYEWSEVLAADPDTIFGITFEKKKLDELPQELSNFKRLISLNLKKNRLTSLPDYFSEFKDLVDLNLEKNKLEYYPIQLCKITSIKYLRLGANLFENVPECIEYTAELVYLDLYDTPIHKIPNSLLNLKNLKVVDLSGIQFSPAFQKSWIENSANIKFVFDAPCDCFE